MCVRESDMDHGMIGKFVEAAVRPVWMPSTDSGGIGSGLGFAAHLSSNSGARFSKKALTASWWSRV